MCEPAIVDALVIGGQGEVDVVLVREGPESKRMACAFRDLDRWSGVICAKFGDHDLGGSEVRAGVAPRQTKARRRVRDRRRRVSSVKSVISAMRRQ